ncbi:inositol monophosphatase [Klebsiella pneumoniae]|uniref:Inositol monophosphatase n=1 Tax=Klebsiella pneumoniae TaxID=573 RepID=A0A939NMA9_KLEPN|nr:inositol monophosphatase [Klebsiella pneumoniae]
MADKRVEAFVKQRIQSAFPEDGFRRRERRPPARRASAGWSTHRWHQLFQRPAHRCLSLAIVADGEPVIGVVYDPNHRELFHPCGAMALGSTTLIRPHPATTVKEACWHLASRHPADFLPFLQALLSDGGMFIRNGLGVDERRAAAGRLIGYEPHMNPWDALPGLVLMREAGGASNDFLAQEIQRGNPLLLASQRLPAAEKMIPQPLH